MMKVRTFLKVLKPARIEPPIHVLYFRSGGANILIFMSLTASLRTSESSRSPNPIVRTRHELIRQPLNSGGEAGKIYIYIKHNYCVAVEIWADRKRSAFW